MWEIPNVSVTVDNTYRVRLAKLVKPGEEYATETPQSGVIILRRMEPVATGSPKTAAQVRAAIQHSRTRLVCTWPEVKAVTRA